MTSFMSSSDLSVMVFAHNNESTIQACLESIVTGGINQDENIYVVINGSGDKTEELVLDLSKKHENIKPIILEFGDRANAWNYYIYEIANPDYHHVFIDGDITISKNSLKIVKDVVSNNPSPLAFSTLPQNGRLQKYWTNYILSKHAMFGNFYCLPSKTIKHIQDIPLLLPVGFLCDDDFITWATLRDFKPREFEDGKLIHPIKNIGFFYDSFSLIKPSGIKSHIKRQFTYSKRNIQSILLKNTIMTHGYKSIPAHITKLYSCRKIIKCIFDKPSVSLLLFPFAAMSLCKNKNSNSMPDNESAIRIK